MVFLIRWFIDLPLTVAIVGPLAGAYGATRALRLALSPLGVELANRSSPWELMELRSTCWGESLRTRPGLTKGTKRVSVFLPLYGRDWRSGAIGRDIERWAPQVIGSAMRPEPGSGPADP